MTSRDGSSGLFDRDSVAYCLKCDLRVINARKKGIFCRTGSVAMTPKSTTSLWGVAAKWPTRAPKTKLILCPRDPQGYSRISLSLSGRILRVPVFHGVCQIAPTEVLAATQMGVMRRSKKVSSFELCKFNPLSPHSGRLRGCSCIVIPGVVCKLLQFAATQ